MDEFNTEILESSREFFEMHGLKVFEWIMLHAIDVSCLMGVLVALLVYAKSLFAKKVVGISFALISAIYLITAYGLPIATGFVLQKHYSLPLIDINSIALAVFLASAGSLLVLRLITLIRESAKNRFVIRSWLQRDGKTDVRNLKNLYPNTRRQHKPNRYFSKDHYFFGMAIKRKTVKIENRLTNKQHMAVTGPTGSGKGVLLQLLMAQAIIKGESVVYLDPNGDNIALRVLEQEAKRNKRPFIYIDLSGEQPQWNPWSDQSTNEIEELCAAVFGLSDNFDIADVHRLMDRDAAIAFAKVAANKQLLPIQLISQLLKADSSISSDAKKFFKDLSQLADMPVVNISHGFDVLDAIQSRAVVFVRGSTRNPRVLKLQRLFTLAVIHAVEKRNRHELDGPSVFFVLDEYKYSVSPQSTEALATIRKMNCHLAIASQSYTDLRNCPKDMDPDSVISSVVENAGIHVNYKSNDIELAEKISNSTGSIAIDEEIRDLEVNNVWAEQTSGHRSLRKAERNLIDTNMIMNMPEGCAVLRWNGLSQIIQVCPLDVDMESSLPKPTVFRCYQESNSDPKSLSEELIDVD